MEMETELFETSEMLAVFLASTPVLSESWRLCSHANATAPGGFIVNQIGDVGYIAFSGIQVISGLNPNGNNLVLLNGTSSGLSFSPREVDDSEEPPMVHSGFLHIFHSIYNNPCFQNQISMLMQNSKSLIVTGHSVGGATASLATLWLLSYLQSLSSSFSVLCITFGSPLLGNESLSKTILRERWGGKFCHVVLKNDIVPRLLFAPLDSIATQLNHILQFWHLSMTPQYGHLVSGLSSEEKTEFYHYILNHTAAYAAQKDGSKRCSYWPFGSYLFFSGEGAVCIENATSVIQMLYLMFTTGSANSCIDDHLKYGDVAAKVSQLLLMRRSFTQGILPESGYEAGISLAIEASGIAPQDTVVNPARECLKMAKQMGRKPNLNSASLAIGLAKVTPYRAQIEWYKETCDNSEDQMGYYDSFKLRGASKKDSQVNMNRFKLAVFWNNVIRMLETNQLPHDFHRRAKWVNASQFYKLLVEPLDIAEYYRTGMHKTKGHYLTHGRERRYEIFDRWWRGREDVSEDNNSRTRFASLTQDSCFWARVEMAKEWMQNAKGETDPHKLAPLWESMNRFELYASQLVEKKEVSKDVVAKNSSYSLWLEEWKEFKSQLLQIPGRL
ncbi:PREDICTED: lipase-like PAD4 [Nelumbo nucifera]|uniref:Lipase-like PAD4 n=2 Tax=Nelumbo nucifera TaxID=4432 RepID=A0A822Z8W2_NELNU|nr:PREDICTED: lipase-like PAD4 [Nelumbo nucifera]DAD39789.1 TPA_asm: hypothetical protein HUJ06_014112 [Nelumbo nucifera]